MRPGYVHTVINLLRQHLVLTGLDTSAAGVLTCKISQWEMPSLLDKITVVVLLYKKYMDIIAK